MSTEHSLAIGELQNHFWLSFHSVFDIELLNLLHNFTLIPIGRRQNANDGLTENSDFLPNLVVLRWHSPAQAHPVMLYIAWQCLVLFGTFFWPIDC